MNTAERFSGAAVASATDTEPVGVITMDQAVDFVLRRNKELAVLAWRVKATRSAAWQAGVLPNPEIDIAIDNFGGSDEFNGFDGAETTIALSQAIELGGKRQKRRRVAEIAVLMASREYQLRKMELTAAARQAVIGVLASQRRLELAREQLRLAEQATAAVEARVTAGKVPPLERTRARVALSSSRIFLNKVQRQLAVSRNQLAALWGASDARFEKIAGDLRTCETMPVDIADLQERLASHPAITLLASEVELRKAELQLARAARIPDLTVSGGVRRFEDTGGSALVAGISMPLMVFDRNQGGIGEAQHNLAAARDALAAAISERRAALLRAWQQLLAARAEAELLDTEVLAGARQAFDAARQGYQQGKFGYLDMLDAQKTLFEVTGSQIEALEALQIMAVEVKKTAGLFYGDPDRDSRQVAVGK